MDWASVLISKVEEAKRRECALIVLLAAIKTTEGISIITRVQEKKGIAHIASLISQRCERAPRLAPNACAKRATSVLIARHALRTLTQTGSGLKNVRRAVLGRTRLERAS